MTAGGLGGSAFGARAIFPDTMENQLLEQFFAGATGYFVEVGANDPVIDSKTWNLEQKGWTGLLVEPQPEHADRLRSMRKSDVACFACGPSSRHGTTMTLYVAGVRGIHASLNHDHHVAGSHVTKTIRVPIRTLDSVLHEYKAPRPINLLAVDTEGSDVDVLEGADLDTWKPQLILVEDLVLNLSTHTYLKGRGYRWIRRTGLNSWYVPDDCPAKVSLFGRWQFFRKYYLGRPFRVLREARRLRRSRAAREVNLSVPNS
jgi:FkbM family methyltransferase